MDRVSYDKLSVLIFLLLWLVQSCSNSRSKNPQKNAVTPSANADLSTPFSAAGSDRDYPGIFSLLPTVLYEAGDRTAGVAYCNDPENLGHVFRYLDANQTAKYHYQNCLGSSLGSKEATTAVSYYKAFSTAPEFPRNFTGYVYFVQTGDNQLQYECRRLPEDRSSQGSLKLSDPITDICGDVFAFKFSIEDPSDLSSGGIVFAGGGPEPLEYGQFR